MDIKELKNNKPLIVILILSFLSVLIIIFDVFTFKSITEVKNNIETSKNELKATNAKLAKLENIAANESIIKDNLAVQAIMLPEQIDDKFIINMLEEYAHTHNVMVDAITIDDIELKDTYKSRKVTVSINGTYNNVVKFSEDVSCTDNITILDKLYVEKDGSDKINVSADIEYILFIK
ncbi:MAG: type 4a pilus biogenesis protein PilO [Oscillospiraceae bacterium]